jgi:hypothetical protein
MRLEWMAGPEAGPSRAQAYSRAMQGGQQHIKISLYPFSTGRRVNLRRIKALNAWA